MTDHKKKGDFHKTDSHEERVGGNQKAHDKNDSDSRTGDKQNAGHGGHK